MGAIEHPIQFSCGAKWHRGRVHRRSSLRDEVQIEISIEDEINTRIRPERVTRAIRASSDGGLVALIGVQSNQFPRAVGIARPIRAAGRLVCIGGFHVSGSLSLPPRRLV